jgi:hypothetical protein
MPRKGELIWAMNETLNDITGLYVFRADFLHGNLNAGKEWLGVIREVARRPQLEPNRLIASTSQLFLSSNLNCLQVIKVNNAGER